FATLPLFSTRTASKWNCRIFCSNPFSLCVLMLFLSYVLFLRKYFFASVFGFCHPKQRSHQTDTGCDRQDHEEYFITLRSRPSVQTHTCNQRSDRFHTVTKGSQDSGSRTCGFFRIVSLFHDGKMHGLPG